MKARPTLPGNPGHHAVQLYVDDRSLCESAADFLSDGIAASQSTLVVAAPLHCDLIAKQLSARRFDLPAMIASGSMLFLDAQELLDVVSANGQIDAARFRELVGVTLDRVNHVSAEPVVRVYGELVDVLWRGSRIDAALEVEVLWNELLATHSFSLLCGCAMTPFIAHPAHQKVCACHTDVHCAAAAA